jgi:hypothetical protein
MVGRKVLDISLFRPRNHRGLETLIPNLWRPQIARLEIHLQYHIDTVTPENIFRTFVLIEA